MPRLMGKSDPGTKAMEDHRGVPWRGDFLEGQKLGSMGTLQPSVLGGYNSKSGMEMYDICISNLIWFDMEISYCWWKKSGQPVEVGSLSGYLQGIIHPREPTTFIFNIHF